MSTSELDFAGRRQQIYQRLSPSEETAYYTNDLSNIRYLTGFRGTAASLLLSAETSYLLLDGRYPPGSQENLAGGEDLKITRVEQKRLGALNDLLEENNIEAVHFEKNNLSYSRYRSIVDSLVASERNYGRDWIRQQRQRKSAAEIDRIRTAIKRSLALFELVETWIEPGITEIELNQALRRELEGRGESRAFYPLVLFGERTAYPHAPPTDRTLGEGDPVLVDLGLQVAGYCSDLTRMYFCGENEPVEELYELACTTAQKLCAELQPGLKAQEVDGRAQEIIAEAGYEENIRHGPGHGVGLEIHESPSLSKRDETSLEQDMVLTVEPGIYVENVGGGRVEHMVRITESGAEVLDKFCDRTSN